MEKQPNRTAAKKIFHVVGLLALALVSVYIIVQCFVVFRRSYKTETAIKYTLAESITLDGVVAFDSVDVAGSGDLGYLVQDGERVTNGTVVAEVYTDDSQGLQRERLDRLERTITLLTKSQNSTGSDLSVLTNQTKQALYNLLDKINTAQYSGITDAEDTFLLAQNRLQVSTGQTAGFADTIAALQVEYDSIKAQLDALQTITATTNGYFSSTAASPAIARHWTTLTRPLCKRCWRTVSRRPPPTAPGRSPPAFPGNFMPSATWIPPRGSTIFPASKSVCPASRTPRFQPRWKR